MKYQPWEDPQVDAEPSQNGERSNLPDGLGFREGKVGSISTHIERVFAERRRGASVGPTARVDRKGGGTSRWPGWTGYPTILAMSR
jgi:hypothetical protein